MKAYKLDEHILMQADATDGEAVNAPSPPARSGQWSAILPTAWFMSRTRTGWECAARNPSSGRDATRGSASERFDAQFFRKKGCFAYTQHDNEMRRQDSLLRSEWHLLCHPEQREESFPPARLLCLLVYPEPPVLPPPLHDIIFIYEIVSFPQWFHPH